MNNQKLAEAIDHICSGADVVSARDIIHEQIGSHVLKHLEEKKKALAQAFFTGEMAEDREEIEEKHEPITDDNVVRKTAKAGAIISGVPGAALGAMQGAHRFRGMRGRARIAGAVGSAVGGALSGAAWGGASGAITGYATKKLS